MMVVTSLANPWTLLESLCKISDIRSSENNLFLVELVVSLLVQVIDIFHLSKKEDFINQFSEEKITKFIEFSEKFNWKTRLYLNKFLCDALNMDYIQHMITFLPPTLISMFTENSEYSNTEIFRGFIYFLEMCCISDDYLEYVPLDL